MFADTHLFPSTLVLATPYHSTEKEIPPLHKLLCTWGEYTLHHLPNTCNDNTLFQCSESFPERITWKGWVTAFNLNTTSYKQWVTNIHQHFHFYYFQLTFQKFGEICCVITDPQHYASPICCRSTKNVWVKQCGATKGRLCPNHTEAELYRGQSTSTKVHYNICIHDLPKNLNIFCHFVRFPSSMWNMHHYL